LIFILLCASIIGLVATALAMFVVCLALDIIATKRQSREIALEDSADSGVSE
jgi:hypothetical protein